MALIGKEHALLKIPPITIIMLGGEEYVMMRLYQIQHSIIPLK